jgi:hypothetical protein
MARAIPLLRCALLLALVGLGGPGCQLIADFDRSKIPTDAGQLPEAGPFDAGLDAQFLDADIDGSLDGMLPFDAGPGADSAVTDDAGSDDDAGDDDAG